MADQDHDEVGLIARGQQDITVIAEIPEKTNNNLPDPTEEEPRKPATSDAKVLSGETAAPTMGMSKEQSQALKEISRRATRVSQRKRESRVCFAAVPEIINEVYEGGDGERVTEDGDDEAIKEEQNDLLKYVENNVIGNETAFEGPYGSKRVIYCDYTASGRPVKFIEEYITQHVHPLYANTHTTTGLMARQTTQFRKEARQIIKSSVNACADDVLIFCGSGTTAAVNKLVSALKLKSETGTHTIVLVGPFEHHSNILPWKESGATVVRIKDTKTGHIDVEDLECKLQKYKKKPHVRLIGCFSAASNVTGILTDTHEIAAKLHEHGALSFWDYATAGPYLKIDMNPPCDNGENYTKDAVYLSPHKFVGGVGTPGILLAKKHVFLNEVPDTVGGGTVAYVTRDTHHYHDDIEEREEGGTPAIVESIRAGLTFKLKDAIGTELIEERELELTRLAFGRWKKNDRIIILGSSRASRLPIFSFLITHPNSGKVLHHDFVAVILNDLFGIQARGGCACAGPYAQDLLGIDEDLAQKFVHFLVKDESMDDKGRKLRKKKKKGSKEWAPLRRTIEIMKPGFVRLNLPFFYSDEAIEYILAAVEMVAADGWVMLPQYRAEPFTAKWSPIQVETQNEDNPKPSGDSLLSATFEGAKFSAPSSPYTQREATKKSYQDMLDDAKKTLSDAKEQKLFSVEAIVDEVGAAVNDDELIWFLRPQEAALHLRNKDDSVDGIQTGEDPRAGASKVPFKPKRYTVLRKSFRRRFSRASSKNVPKKDGAKKVNDDGEEKKCRRARCTIM